MINTLAIETFGTVAPNADEIHEATLTKIAPSRVRRTPSEVADGRISSAAHPSPDVVVLVATVSTRLAVCTVPLAFVFAAEQHTGSYAWGAVLAGEAVAAPRMGARWRHRPLRTELAGVAVAEAIALVGVVVTLRFGAPIAAAVLAALGGGVASGTFGGLRTLLVKSAPDGRESAPALDVVVNQVCQIAGPALAGAVLVAGSADLALPAVGGTLLITVAVAPRLPKSLGGGAASPSPRSPARVSSRPPRAPPGA